MKKFAAHTYVCVFVYIKTYFLLRFFPLVIFQLEPSHLGYFFFHILFWPLLHIPLLATRLFACYKEQELPHRGHQCIRENIRYFWMLSKTSFDIIKGTQQCKAFLLLHMEQRHLKECMCKGKWNCFRLHLALGNHRNKTWGQKKLISQMKKIQSEILALVIPWYSPYLRIWVVFARNLSLWYFISYMKYFGCLSICSKSQ